MLPKEVKLMTAESMASFNSEDLEDRDMPEQNEFSKFSKSPSTCFLVFSILHHKYYGNDMMLLLQQPLYLLQLSLHQQGADQLSRALTEEPELLAKVKTKLSPRPHLHSTRHCLSSTLPSSHLGTCPRPCRRGKTST